MSANTRSLAETWPDLEASWPAWEESLRVAVDIEEGELPPARELVEVEVSVCSDEFCESCDTVFAW